MGDEAEIAELVKIKLQDIVDELVGDSNPMNDPDFELEAELEGEQELNGTLDDDQNIDWRLELNDALNVVRERGRFDGQRLAERIAATFYEVNGVEASLDQFEAEQNEKYEQTEKLWIEQGKTTKNAEGYNLWFGAGKESNLFKAIESFKMRNCREPTNLEVARLKDFVSLNVSKKKEDEKKYDVSTSKVLVTPVKKKKSAARYNVYFGQTADSKDFTLEKATKWFERFNGRKPTDSELGGIRQFIEAEIAIN